MELTLLQPIAEVFVLLERLLVSDERGILAWVASDARRSLGSIASAARARCGIVIARGRCCWWRWV